MLRFLFGIIAGICIPVQTGVNTRLKKSVGSPFYTALLSFFVGWLFLVALLLITGDGLVIPFDRVRGEPLWIWSGGPCGLVFLLGNILLFPHLGGIQTVILPVLGQILMGLIIDSFGLFRSVRIPISAFRAVGAVLVFAGVVIVSAARNALKAEDGTRNAKAPEVKEENPLLIWFLRVFGVSAGMLSAVQTACNGYLGGLIGSPVRAAVVSFSTGMLLMFVICVCIWTTNRKRGNDLKEKTEPFSLRPLWKWTGGILGTVFVMANVTLSRTLGTGMTVITVLIGSAAGGLLVDRFGLFGTEVKKINARKVLGAALMAGGAAMIRLL